MQHIKKEGRRVKRLWVPYPDNKPVPGWCATTDGGDIRLVIWSDGSWIEKNDYRNRDIVEFMQVTVNI